MASRKLPMLLQRNGVWTYRRVVPPELRPFLKAREVWRSLKCEDVETAKLRALEVGLEVERQLQDAKRRLALGRGSLPTPDALARDWQERELAADETWRQNWRERDVEAELQALGDALEDNAEALDVGDTRLVSGLLLELLQPYGVTPAAKDMQRFARALLKARLSYLETARKRTEAEYLSD